MHYGGEMFNPQIEKMEKYNKIYLKTYTQGSSFVYGEIDFFDLKEGSIFIAHGDDGPLKNSENRSEFYATSDPYTDELGIPCINVRAANEHEKGKTC